MNKEFVLILEKSPFDDENYGFLGILKTQEDKVITDSNLYGKDIFSVAERIDLSEECVNEVVNASKKYQVIVNPHKRSVMKTNPTIIKTQVKSNITKGNRFVAIKIGEDYLKEKWGRDHLSESEIIAELYQAFKECVKNVSFKNGVVQFDMDMPSRTIRSFSDEVKYTINERNQASQVTAAVSEKNLVPATQERDISSKERTNSLSSSASRTNAESMKKSVIEKVNNLKTQSQVVEYLKGRIIAQDKAIEDVVATLFLNQIVINHGNKDMITTAKANILIDGPTGTGKTMLIKELSDLMSLPMVNTSITAYSTTGYRGNDLSDILIKLLDMAEGDQELAERGIVCLDEFDKLGYTNDKSDLTMKKALQEELLTYLSGAKFDIEYKGKKIEFDTSKITFVALGAFTNLRERKISDNEKKNKSSLGFSADTEFKDYKRTIEINTDDYIQEGIIREIVGRLTTKTYTMALGVDDYKDIMKKSAVSPLKCLEELCEFYGKRLVYDDETIDYIASLAYENNTGARGIQNIFNGLNRRLIKTLAEGKETNVEISSEMVTEIINEKVRKY